MSSSPQTEVAADAFVCDCDEWMQAACDGLPFYKEHESKRYCVLHYPGKNKSTDFNEALQKKLETEDFNFCGVWFPDEIDFNFHTFAKPVAFDEATFNLVASFSHATFSADASFARVTFDATAYFEYAEFGGHASFSHATFSEKADFMFARFHAEASFSQATFGAMVHFNTATFDAETSFDFARFDAKLDFKNARFTALVNFSSARFGAETYFGSTNFGAEAAFNSATFGADTSFDSATFSARVSFYYTRFNATVSFDEATFNAEAFFGYATFGAPASFDRATFRAEADFGSAAFKDYVKFAGTEEVRVFGDEASLSLQFARIENPERVSFHTVKLRPHWFVNVDPRTFEFTYVVWHWYGRKIRWKLKRQLHEKAIPSYVLLAQACRRLAVNAEENNIYWRASSFRYLAMNVERLDGARGFAFWTVDWWYWLASGFGERISRALIVFLVIWLSFAFLFSLPSPVRCPEDSPRTYCLRWEKKDETRDYFDSFSNSAVYAIEAMTLQKPEPKPASPSAHLAVMLCTLLGPVQAALLALAIRRKFMR